MGLKSDGDDGIDTFFRANIRGIFQASGKTLFINDALNNLVKCVAIVGNALAIVLYGYALWYTVFTFGLGLKMRSRKDNIINCNFLEHKTIWGSI